MSRLDDMAGRLHPLLREGELLRAALAPAAVAAEIATENIVEIGRAHRFDDVLELGEAVRLAALLDIHAEPWQTLPLFRAWVHATRDALLDGAVTRSALEGFARRYAAAHQGATRARVGTGQPTLVDNPSRRATAQPDGLAMPPLAKFSVTVTSLADTAVSMLLTGLAAGPEAAPLIANLNTGAALIWRGRVPPGARLTIRATAEGNASAMLDGVDVTDRLVGLTGFTPGEAWTPAQVTAPAPAITLRRGDNRLWFLPVALYDTDGLDRFLLALPDLDLAEGRWDSSVFDHALFDQPAAVQLLATWIEAEPAALALDVPAELVLRPATATGSPAADRDRLLTALDAGIQRLKAAGIRAATRARAFSNMQPASDRLVAVLPMRLKEAGSSGGERMPDAGGLWGVTPFDGSTFR
jgi:hypothetical protein